MCLEEIINFLNENVGKKNFVDNRYGKFYVLNNKIKRIKNKKKVLLFSHELTRTGAPIVLFDVAKILKKMGYFVLLISVEDGELAKEIVENDIPVIILKSLKKIELVPYDYKKKIDIDDFINDFDFSIFNTIVLYNFIKHYINKKNKIIWWIHEGITIVDIPEIYHQFPKKVSNNVNVFCVSEYSKKILETRGLNYNPRILSYGVKNVKLINKKINKNKKVKFISVGTICDRKGQKTLIDAIKSLPSSINDKSEYYFVGIPSKEDKYGCKLQKEIVDLCKSNNFIHYIEKLKRNDMLKLISQMDVLILTSKDDPLPVVGTEAFMLGKTVITSKNTGTYFYIKNKENGLTFDTGNFQNLMNMISFCVNNKNKLKTIGKKGKKIYKNYFTNRIFKKNLKKGFIINN